MQTPLFYSKKASTDVIRIIMYIVIIGIVAVVMLSLFSNQAENAERMGECQGALGGVWAEECKENISTRASMFEEQDGKVCCVKNVGLSDRETEEFEKWREDLVPDSSKSASSSPGDDSEGSSPSGSDRNVLKLQDTELLLQEQQDNEDVFFRLNDRSLAGYTDLEASKESNILHLKNQRKYTFTVINNMDTVKSCEMGIYKAESIAGKFRVADADKNPVSGLYARSTDCTKLTALYSIGVINEQGYYVWDVKLYDENGEESFSRKRVLRVKEDISEDKIIKQKIQTETRIVPSNGVDRCMVSSRLQEYDDSIGKYFDVENEDVTVSPEPYYIGNKQDEHVDGDELSCPPMTGDAYGTKIEVVDATMDDVNLDFAKDGIQGVCLKFDVSSNEYDRIYPTSGATELVTLSSDQCDTLEFMNYSTFKDVFYECPYPCKEYDNQKISCNDRASRNPQCQLAIDCYWESQSFFNTKCKSCSENMRCEDYDNEKTCESNQCVPGKTCFWEDSASNPETRFKTGLCMSCSEKPACSKYDSKQTCEKNPCDAYEAGESACTWNSEKNRCTLSEEMLNAGAPEEPHVVECDDMKRDECESDGSCWWDYDVLGGNCYDCSMIDESCSNYPDKNSCQEDYCGVGNCNWDDGECQ